MKLFFAIFQNKKQMKKKNQYCCYWRWKNGTSLLLVQEPQSSWTDVTLTLYLLPSYKLWASVLVTEHRRLFLFSTHTVILTLITHTRCSSLQCYAFFFLLLTALRCVNYSLHLLLHDWIVLMYQSWAGNGSRGNWLRWPDVSYLIFQRVLTVSCRQAGKGQIIGSYCWVAWRSDLDVMTLICALEHTRLLLQCWIVIFRTIMYFQHH